MRINEVLHKPSSPVQLGLAFALLSVVFSLLAAIYLFYSWQTVKRERIEALRSTAELSASSAELFLQQYQHSLPSLARDIVDHDDADYLSEAKERLQRYAQADPKLAAAYFFSLTGELLASSTGEIAKPNTPHMQDPVFRADFLRTLSQDTPYIGRTRFGKMVDSWIMPIRMRVDDPKSAQTLGVLSIVIRTTHPQGLWREIQLPPAWNVRLVRDDGYVQAAYPFPQHPEASFGDPVAPAPWVDAHRADSGVIEPREAMDQNQSWVAYRRLPSFDMTAYVQMPGRDIWRSWVQHVRVTLVLFLLSLAAMWFAARWTIRQQRAREAERNAADATLRQSQAALKRQTQLLEQSQRAAKIGGWELDVASGALYWTEETYRIHEVAPESYSPNLHTLPTFYAPDSARMMTWALDHTRRTGESWDHELELVTYKGNTVWVRSTGKAERDAAGKISKIWGSYQDITQRRATEERIRHMAHYDAVTGLPNRNLFNAHLGHALERARRTGSRLAVLFIDLDRFKNINDAIGHDVGDRVLKLIGERLTQIVRAVDVLARLGGDEFIIALEEVADVEAIGVLAGRILVAIEEPVIVNDDEFMLSASIGIATFPADGTDTATLIKNADVAMYRAKEQGKNRYEFYSEQMSRLNIQRLTLETQLKKATQEGNQFLLHYQPRWSLAEERISTVEALIRWQHPERGLVEPNDFVPVAEETGLIHRMGAWVLRKACQDAADWQRRTGVKTGVAVNLSARELYGKNLVEDIRQTLAESGLSPASLELEITETVMLHNLPQVAEVLGQLKDLGLSLAVDDFGTGYSSLSHLRRLPLDCIKIDRSFIRNVPDNANDVAITRALVAMAHSLRIIVVAEGVETPAQLRFLQELNCDEAQGYLISKPLALRDLLKVFEQEAVAPVHALAF